MATTKVVLWAVDPNHRKLQQSVGFNHYTHTHAHTRKRTHTHTHIVIGVVNPSSEALHTRIIKQNREQGRARVTQVLLCQSIYDESNSILPSTISWYVVASILVPHLMWHHFSHCRALEFVCTLLWHSTHGCNGSIANEL